MLLGKQAYSGDCPGKWGQVTTLHTTTLVSAGDIGLVAEKTLPQGRSGISRGLQSPAPQATCGLGQAQVRQTGHRPCSVVLPGFTAPQVT